MAFKEQQYLYEVLIRFNNKGYTGSHQIYMKQIIDDVTNEVITEQTQPAEPLAPENIEALINKQTSVLLLQISNLEKQIKELKS